MTNEERKVLELALQFIESNADSDSERELVATIKEALAQPEQWGASAVTHPEYIAEQKAKTQELRSMLAQPEQDWIERERAVGYREGHQNALKQMAQPEQEPVAWVVYSSAENDIVWADKGKRLKQNTPLYTAPPQRKPLTSQERDAKRWRFLMENSYDSESVTQFHVWEHSWEPHSQTGEPTEWKQRVRGIALIDFIDRAIEAAHGIKE